MAFVPGDSFQVDHTTDGVLAVTDLRVTPGGGFQVVWDTADGFSGSALHQTSYRIFDPAGQPLTDEITDASFHGDTPPSHLQRSIALDDGTTLKVETVYNTTGPGSRLVLQLYDQSGTPLGGPVFTAFIDNGRGGLAQLPNRDIVFVATSTSKTGVYGITSWVLDNTSPDLYAPVLTRIEGANGAAQVAPDGTIVVRFNELVSLAPSARIDLKTAGGELVDSFDASDGAALSAWVSSLTIDPAVSLDPGVGYVLEFAPGSVLDPGGNAFAGGAFRFTTAGDAPPPSGDTAAPAAVDFFPAAGSTMLPPGWSLGITFDEDVKAGSGSITLQTASGAVVQAFATAGDPGIRFAGQSVIIDPAADLQPGTTYRLVVDAAAVVDLAGNAYAGVSGYSFTTAGTAPVPAPDATAPAAIDFFPAAGSTMLPPDWNLGITFDEDVQAGSGTITLRTAAGDVVQTFATAGDPGIQFIGSSVVINPAADLLPRTAYTLTVDGSAVVDLVGNPYAGVAGYSFTTAG